MAADQKYRKLIENFGVWFSCHYMLVINSLLAIFLLGTLAAPVAMKSGWENTAKTIYLFYRQFCHQFAFRSWFLFGKQAYYPKETFGNLFSYEEVFHMSAGNLQAARKIIGSETAGYKMAICQRDFSMYTALLLSGIIYAFTGSKLKRIPLWIWFLAGVLPVGLDGISQLTSTGLQIPGLNIMRESTPLLRSITGGLFGLFTGWYIYPILSSILQVTTENPEHLRNERHI